MNTTSCQMFSKRGGVTAALLVFCISCVSLPCLAQTNIIERTSLKGMFLVARDRIADPRFSHSVLLITQHDENGAIGLMINHPTKILASRILPDIPELQGRPETVFIGGPLTDVPLMLLIENPLPRHLDSVVKVVQNVYFSMNYTLIPDCLELAGTQLRMFLGLASWAPGQLEAELLEKVWDLQPADAESIFSKTPSGLWDRLSNDRNSLNWVMDQGYLNHSNGAVAL